MLDWNIERLKRHMRLAREATGLLSIGDWETGIYASLSIFRASGSQCSCILVCLLGHEGCFLGLLSWSGQGPPLSRLRQVRAVARRSSGKDVDSPSGTTLPKAGSLFKEGSPKEF